MSCLKNALADIFWSIGERHFSGSGERVTVEAVKRVREWFWVNDSGKINLGIKYGAKTLALNKKGANAIELSSGDELIATLKTLKTAVANGEFDEAISEASKATKLAFSK
jgi:hypothetical protein